jgi:HPt (histidine-containing phosphotransfer) domain-containing protein
LTPRFRGFRGTEVVIDSDSKTRTSQVLDAQALERLHRLGGKQLVDRMIDLFSTHTGPTVAQALASFAAGDYEGVERAAHSLKSSAANLGAEELKYLAEEIEQAAPSASRPKLEPLMAQLQSALERALHRLQQERS